ncbi:TolC family protein [Mariniphaga sediminis]|uniref:TolC family protein n=1 Tax=Mariniphaga sediminis TaxID=1628158 RepID=A0A399CZK8_9BACT|nr:TolC family protein [Mariniphaga sediminis]RIH64656.1 TolC family protein [Mariniphaga sediminis]
MKIIINTIIVMLVAISGGSAQSLDDYFKIAAENNPGLQAKYKTFEAAMQKVPQVNSLPDPTFSFGYFISPVETRVGPQRAKFSLTQMFPWFGTLKARGDAATLMAEAKYQAFLDARNRLYFQVASAWYPLYELNKWKKLEKENIAILNSYKNITTRKFENGNSPMVDVLRVDILLKEAETRLRILDDKEKPLLSAFNSLLNRNETSPVEVIDSLTANIFSVEMKKDSLLEKNPVLAELDLKMHASEASETAAQKKGLPNIGVGLDYVVVGQPSGMTSADNGKDVLMPMVSVSIPLFRKKYRAAEQEARLMQESFSLQKKNVLNTLVSEFDRASFTLQQQQQLVRLYEEQISTTRQSLNLLFTAYGNSGKEFEEVLRMQQQLLQYQKNKATALAEFQTAQAKINYLTAKTIHDENK